MNLLEVVHTTGLLAVNVALICIPIIVVILMAMMFLKVISKYKDRCATEWKVPEYLQILIDEMKWLGALQQKVYPNQNLADEISDHASDILRKIDNLTPNELKVK